MNFFVIYVILLTYFISATINLDYSPIYKISNIISALKLLRTIGPVENSTTGVAMISEMAIHDGQTIMNQILIEDKIQENIKWGIRGIAMFLLPAMIGMLPLIEHKLFNIFCEKGKRVYNVGFSIEKETLCSIE